MTRLLLRRLLNRGHKFESLEPIFKASVASIEQKEAEHFNTETTSPSSTSNRLFMHIPYHPKDISRKHIRDVYDGTCKKALQCIHNDETDGKLKIDNFTIAYSRPSNLRDLLCPSKLVETEEHNVAKYAKGK